MKQNTAKHWGHRVLAWILALVLLMQAAPISPITARAEETADVAAETVSPEYEAEATEPTAEETVPEAEATEPAAEETVPEAEATEPAAEETVPETEATEPAAGETVPEAEATEAAAEEIVPETEATEPAAEETVSESETTEPVAEETELDTEEIDPYTLLAAAEEGYIEVTSPEQLLSGVPEGSTYVLAGDVTLGAGQTIPVVAGTLDGKGYTITLTDSPLSQEVTGTIQNLGIVSINPINRMQVGSMTIRLNGGKLYNCWSAVDIADTFFDELGGMIHTATAGAQMRNCFYTGTINGTMRGAMAYKVERESAVKIENCYYVNSDGKLKPVLEGETNGHSITQKTLEEMKEPAFAESLNQQSLGTGYIWEAVAGELPRLVPGGDAVEPCNKAELEAVIREAQGKNESDYTRETWAVMQEALNAAKKINEKIDAKQAEVDEATNALRQAIDNLAQKERDPFPVELPQSGVIPISSQADFSQIDGTDPTKFYQLTQDIVIEGDFWSRNLAGVFDGNGHTITMRTKSSLFGNIVETGVVQNLQVKVVSGSTGYNDFAPYAEELKGGMIVNCISEVNGQQTAGFVMKMTDGTIANCLTMGHNRRGAFVHYQKSTDHRNSNGYKGGKLYNCYWSASNSVENIQWIASENLINCKAASDEELRSSAFIQMLNGNRGGFGAEWGRNAEGYPYFGADQGENVIDGSNNRYPVEFVWHNGDVVTVENGMLELSPQMTDSNRFAGTFRLKNVPADSTITWECQDRADREVLRMDDDRLFAYFDGGAVVRATEHKADGSEQLVAELRVISASRTIEELRLLLDGQVIDGAASVQGSADKMLEIQARYEGSTEFKPLPAYLVNMVSAQPELLHTTYNSSAFYFSAPGTCNLTVTAKSGGASVTVALTSEYVPVKSVKPGISGVQMIHSRNSMGSGQFNDIPATIVVEPANASYKNDFVVESSNREIAEFGGRMAYVPYRAGTVIFTAKVNDRGRTVEGTSEVTFVYENPLVSVTMPSQKISAEVGQKQFLDLTFEGKNSQYAAVSEPELMWSYSQTGIVSINRPNPLMQLRGTGTVDNGNWVSSTQYELKALKPGTVRVTGTPVDNTAGAEPVTFTVTVTGDIDNIPVFDIPKFITEGKKIASQHLMENNNYSFGQEWSIYALLRDGQTLPQDKLDSYYGNVAATVKSWKPDILASEIERTALAVSIMGKDITDVDGVNLADMICNHPNLTRQGSNALAWGLIALDLKNTPVPAGAKWTRESMVRELLTYQNEDGGFGLDKKGGSGLDVTAMALQALTYYQNLDGVQEAVNRGIAYLAKVGEQNLDYGNAESISQTIIALSVLGRDLVAEPGFGDQVDNLMSVLSEYMVEGQGFEHAKGQGVNTMATVQAMQALCAYERFLNGESGYWDLLGSRPVFDPVANVIGMIDQLPETVTLNDIDIVRAARKAFDALRPEQQKKVTNLQKLEAAEEAIRNLSQDDQKALEVMDLISALPGSPSLKDAQQVRDARKAYDSLTEKQQGKVTNVDKLLKAEKTIADLEAAQGVIGAIQKLPKPITADAKGAVEAARKAFDSLTEDQKALVVNRYMLEKAEKELEDALAVKNVEDAIAALPESITEEDAETIKAVRAAYNQLPAELRERVGNLDKLEKVEKALKALRKPGGKPGGVTETESNTIDAVVKNGIVSAKQLADIRGKDKILRIKGTMETGEEYVLAIHGKDIGKAADLKMEMKHKGLYEQEIQKLSENPEIFRFVETGTFPGSMMVEMETGLADGAYLLLHYDPVLQKASLVSRVEAADGKVQFIVKEGGEYFLAKKASTKSVPELEAEKDSATEPQKQENQITVEETKPVQQEETSSTVWIWLPLLILTVACVAILVLLALKKRKENSGE